MDFAAEQEGHGFLPFPQRVLPLLRETAEIPQSAPFYARIGAQLFRRHVMFFCQKCDQAILQSIPPIEKNREKPRSLSPSSNEFLSLLNTRFSDNPVPVWARRPPLPR